MVHQGLIQDREKLRRGRDIPKSGGNGRARYQWYEREGQQYESENRRRNIKSHGLSAILVKDIAMNRIPQTEMQKQSREECERDVV